MKLRRVAVASISLAAFTLLACSDSDTVVALNISAADDVGDVSRLHVRLTQEGKPTVETNIEPPKRDVPDAGKAIVSRFYERITLPESWTDGEASVDVDVYDANGELFLEPEPVKLEIRDEGATAVFVSLARAPIPPPEGGAGGAGGADSETTGGTGGTGASSGGTLAGGSGGTLVGGNGGTAEAGSTAAGGADAGAAGD
jgi:hypothetical protein